MSIFSGVKKVFTDQRVAELQSKLENKDREIKNLKLRITVLEDQYEFLARKIHMFFESREKKSTRTWKVIDQSGERWIRPDALSYVGEIQREPNDSFQLQCIVSNNNLTFSFPSLEEAQSVKSMLLNVDKIPEWDEQKNAALGNENIQKNEKKIKRIFEKRLKQENSIPNREDHQPKVDVEQLEKEVKNRKK